jgi:hypothetical protein
MDFDIFDLEAVKTQTNQPNELSTACKLGGTIEEA